MSNIMVTEGFEIPSRGEADMHDITREVQARVSEHGLREGQALLFVPGSTGALTTIEYEPGLIEDFPAFFDRVAPRGIRYAHEETWHDGNGHSHVRASLLGPSLVVPVAEGKLLLGTWQQIVLVDFDARPRHRRVVVQLSGLGDAT